MTYIAEAWLTTKDNKLIYAGRKEFRTYDQAYLWARSFDSYDIYHS